MKNLFKSIFVLSLIAGQWSSSFGQAVSINSTGTAPDAQSILDISSTDKGVLLPRLTNHTDVTPTGSSDFGLTVYDLTTSSYWYWDGTAWQEIPNMGSIPAVSLDEAYDGGIFINADAGAVDIQGAGGLTVNGITGIGTTSPTAGYKMTVLNGTGPTVKVGGTNTGIGLLVEANAGAEDGISSLHSSTSNSSAYFAVKGEVTNESGVGYLGYHTSGDNSYGVYGQSGTYAGYFDGHINLTGDLRLNGSAGTAGQVLLSQGTGVDPIWGAAGVQSVTAGDALVNSGTAAAPVLDVEADNGLNIDVPNNKVQLGGDLTEATLITLDANPLTIDINGTSTNDFTIQDGGQDHFTINTSGDALFGGDVSWHDANTGGATLFRMFDGGSGNDGNFDIYKDGAVNHSLDGDGDVIFNNQGTVRNFRIESDTEVNMFYVDGPDDQIGIATGAPTQALDVDGSIRMRAGTTTAGWVPVSSGDGTMIWTDPVLLGADLTTASNGLTEVVNDIQLGGPLTQNTTVTQGAFAMDFTSTAIDGFSVDGTTFSVDAASNRIGIGTATPDADLNVGNASGGNILITREGSPTTGQTLGSLNFDAQATTVSTTDAAAVIRGLAAENMGNSNKGGHLTFLTKAIGATLSTAATEKMRITSDGNVGIGVTNPTVKFQVAGDATISGKFNSNGIQESSDKRFKKDIIKLNNALENVLKLEGVSYNWRVDEFPKKRFGTRTEIGLVAQDLEEVYPELVSTDKEGYKSVQYSHMVPVLIEAIKEQQALIEKLMQADKANQERYVMLKEYISGLNNSSK